MYYFRNFYIDKFNYFSERSNEVKEIFEIFLIEHCASDIANKNITCKYQNILV